MSKSLGQYRPAPWDVLTSTVRMRCAGICTPPRRPDRNAASLPIWLAMSSAALRLRLWNVYSFFVTYANLDKPKRHHRRRAEPMIWIAGCSLN
jgi:hypothetical protein